AFVSSQAAAGSIFASADPLRFGGNAIWGEYYAGLIDEIRIYNRALSSGEIQNVMTTPIGSPLHVLGDEIVGAPAAPLTWDDVNPLLEEAIWRWTAALDDPAIARRLRHVDVQVMDLPGSTLGL